MTTNMTTTRPNTAHGDRTAEPTAWLLTGLEMRKMLDTRSGFWLSLAVGVGAVLTVVVQLIWADPETADLASYFANLLVPVAILLPVLGILTFTSEWSQRTALTTFVLVPRRQRVVVAKLVAGVGFATVSVVASLLLALVGNAAAIGLDRATGSWRLPASAIACALLFQVLGVLLGMAFGMLLLNSPAAVVLYFILPTAWQVATAAIDAIRDAAAWLNLQGAMQPLVDGGMDGRGWAQLSTSALVWIAVPLGLGTIRVLRAEVK